MTESVQNLVNSTSAILKQNLNKRKYIDLIEIASDKIENPIKFMKSDYNNIIAKDDNERTLKIDIYKVFTTLNSVIEKINKTTTYIKKLETNEDVQNSRLDIIENINKINKTSEFSNKNRIKDLQSIIDIQEVRISILEKEIELLKNKNN